MGEQKKMQERKDNRTVVYTAGTFDLFHLNHLRMIQYARALGDILIVGVSTDKLVDSYKKSPIIPFEQRIAIIRALKYPDIVIPQHSLDFTKMIKRLNMNVLVLGDDWEGKFDYVKDSGVKVFYFPYGRGVSSTELKERITKKYRALVNSVDSHEYPNVRMQSEAKDSEGTDEKIE